MMMSAMTMTMTTAGRCTSNLTKKMIVQKAITSGKVVFIVLIFEISFITIHLYHSKEEDLLEDIPSSQRYISTETFSKVDSDTDSDDFSDFDSFLIDGHQLRKS